MVYRTLCAAAGIQADSDKIIKIFINFVIWCEISIFTAEKKIIL